MTKHNDIRPFRIQIPQAEVDDLRDRLARTRWPRELEGTRSDRGVPVAVLRPLAEYWRDRFDWRAQEEALNAFPQFLTEVDGQTIHFVHVRSDVPDARPLLMLHGWPSTFVEFLELVGPLTDPVAHGGRAEDAVHVVIPSLPGFGFSPLSGPGWGDLFRVAGALGEVMTRLGYERFLAHGTDVGSGIVGMLPMAAPGRVIATHVNGPSPFPLGPAIPLDGLTGSDAERATRFNMFREDGAGYLHIQATRPQTISYGFTDSPVAQLAWIAEKFAEWSDPAVELAQDAVGIDRLLTTVSLYWFTQTGWSSAHAVRGDAGLPAVRVCTGRGRRRRRMAGAARPAGGRIDLRRGPVGPSGRGRGRRLRGLGRARQRRALPGDGAAGPAGERHPLVLERAPVRPSSG